MSSFKSIIFNKTKSFYSINKTELIELCFQISGLTSKTKDSVSFSLIVPAFDPPNWDCVEKSKLNSFF